MRRFYTGDAHPRRAGRRYEAEAQLPRLGFPHGLQRLAFDTQFGRTLERMKAQDLVAVDSIAVLDRVSKERIPAIVLASDELMRMVGAYGASRVGIGTDMDGIGRSTLPSYAEFAQLQGYLGKRGLKDAEVENVLGGNYLRVLRQALSV